MTSDDGLFSLVQGSATLSYSNNGLTYTGTTSRVDTFHRLLYNLPDKDYAIEYIIIGGTFNNYLPDICVEYTRLSYNNHDGIYAMKLSGNLIFGYYTNYTVPNTIRIEVTGTTSKTIKWYLDDVLLATGTNITQNKLFQLKTQLNRSITIKNLKIEEL